MTRLEVRDSGLARRLGEDIVVISNNGRKEEKKGKLVYYPNKFAVLLADKSLSPIKSGDIVGLRRGSGIAKYDPHFVRHEYVGMSRYT